ncbi:MAG: cytochrome c oxidase assembly protein [Ilumatobacteraceae bacterium]
MVLAEAANPLLDPWRFQSHFEVWLLVAFLIGARVYALRVIGPHATYHRRGEPVVTARQNKFFAAAIAVLWISSDWPIHDIAEEYLYSVHMFQHMALSYFLPPLALMATPAWLFRALFDTPVAGRVVRWFSQPVVAGVLYNAVVLITHIPALVNRSASNGPLHYFLHVLVVTSSLLMWIPVVSPEPSLRIGYIGRMIYLFLMSVVPTIPAAWLTFAEGAVYKHYDMAIRVWGLSVTVDQQIAGAIMKTGGTIFLWSIIVFLWFRRFTAQFDGEQTYRRTSEPLTYDDVTRAFEQVPPIKEDDAPHR